MFKAAKLLVNGIHASIPIIETLAAYNSLILWTLKSFFSRVAVLIPKYRIWLPCTVPLSYCMIQEHNHCNESFILLSSAEFFV